MKEIGDLRIICKTLSESFTAEIFKRWNYNTYILVAIKGQLISKANCQAVDSPKKRTDEFDLFAVKSKKANKTNSSVRFLGEVSRP